MVEHLAAEFDKRQVLGDVSFAVAPKEIRVILGGSGCGKTTLLRHAVGLLTARRAGGCACWTWTWPGADDAARDEVLGRIGMLCSKAAPCSTASHSAGKCRPAAAGALCLSDDATIMDIAWMKLNQVGLGPRHAASIPPQLSGGMRKRAALARAMALDPEVSVLRRAVGGPRPGERRPSSTSCFSTCASSSGWPSWWSRTNWRAMRSIADKVVMLEAGHVVADGPLDVVERMEHPSVRAFFDRTAKPTTSHGPSVWDALGA